MSLRDYKGEKIAIWLAYFLAPSRNKGRKIKKVQNKKIDFNVILKITSELGLEPEVYQDKIHPSTGIAGLLVVKKKYGKYKIIKMINEELNRLK
ncbi:signal recognition particle subunit SRP19/SEC65 family protein [Stygiolobus caldivivus]|uniref:Signal recognition particle 19 kDa protein n=1 Tax=Stygiolobus caldivivus TaxID=2824673 RepID=A0A8D5U6M1_9CREN|nr:signal recognition particle subunit SRP19/SEC65 family protein [Stygiolobus caldivivus]BCU70511.1 hypothetical protein KN1_18080 [Stygiolobus caldivivus]